MKSILKVINLEPKLYSQSAITMWINSVFSYDESTWVEIEQYPDLDNVSTIIIRLNKYISDSEISLFPNLRFIISATTGLDHLNLNLIKSKGIKLFSLRGHDDFLNTIPSTAEMTWALIMALVRKIPKANNDVLNGNWNRDKYLGTQLKNKNIGIVGLGRTGRTIAKYAGAFGLNIYFFDPYQDDYNSSYKCDTLDELFSISDIVTFHVHLDDDTKHILNMDNIHNLKEGSFLINTSRGEVWDERAVCDSVKNNKIAGVATDVLTDEFNDIKDNPIWQLQHQHNIIITPHIGGATIDAMRAAEEYIADFFLNNYNK